LVVENARPHRDRFLVKFEGVTSREDAEHLRGTLYVPASEARQLGDDEFWERDVVGCEVITTDDVSVGPVSAIIPGPAQDLLEVATPKGKRLVPFVEEIVVSVDTVKRRILIQPPEGLLE
jgi:16S rRNA processing protein RimM